MFNDLKTILGPYEREVKYLLKASPNRYNTYLLAYDGHVSKMLIQPDLRTSCTSYVKKYDSLYFNFRGDESAYVSPTHHPIQEYKFMLDVLNTTFNETIDMIFKEKIPLTRNFKKEVFKGNPHNEYSYVNSHR